jgi:UDP-N-acetyl-D-mannosaminuronic acid dehydrogenase
VLVLGATYRGGVKETAYSGVFDLVRGLEAGGASAVVADPMYSDEELTRLGLTPWDGGPIDAAIVQADHAEYRDLEPADVPGAVLVFDGRGILDASRWQASGTDLKVIGQGANAS